MVLSTQTPASPLGSYQSENENIISVRVHLHPTKLKENVKAILTWKIKFHCGIAFFTYLPRIIPSPRPHYTFSIHGNDELGSAREMYNLPVVYARHHHRPFLQQNENIDEQISYVSSTWENWTSLNQGKSLHM